MNPQTTTTFIPKKTFDAQNLTQTKSFESSGSPLIPFLSGIVCAAALIATIAVFSYRFYLESSYAGIQKTLLIYKEQFNENKLERILLLDKKIAAGQEVYHNHVAYSTFFAELGLITLPDIQYDSFDFTRDEKNITYKITGQATSYKTIAQQSRLIGKSPFIKEHYFSGLKLGDDKRVSFNLDLVPTIEGIKYLYEKPKLDAVESQDLIDDKLKQKASPADADISIQEVKDQVIPETVDVNALNQEKSPSINNPSPFTKTPANKIDNNTSEKMIDQKKP